MNRVGDHFFSQCDKSGHFRRPGDLEHFARLNIKKIRYPCLWELVCPQEEGVYDWKVLDIKLNEFRRLGLQPFPGLLHHGSGPAFTSLIDPLFPEKFANYARDFATHFPWIEDYIPIDEMLTTARFSCLYGHWYPHHQSDSSFARALVNQVKASILAMKAIRQVNPKAQFIHVDDIGRAQSTEHLTYQAAFENERRWLSFDLISGKVNPSHPLYFYLIESQISAEELSWLVENPCVPDIIGLNHYLLSNRFLDHRLELYPREYHGRNGFEAYADLGAVDLKEVPLLEPEEIFFEAWERYRRPLAITEVHGRGHREDQLRWFHQIWSSAENLRLQGVDIRAVTAWSLLGNFDWHKLCTVSENFYEPGVFDLRNIGEPLRPTALSRMITSLAQGQSFTHPVLENPGWWKEDRPPKFLQRNLKAAPLVITGGAGTLGQAFAKICERRGLRFVLLQRSELDIADILSVARVLNAIRPWAIINTAGYVKVDQAETDVDQCFRVNTEGSRVLAEYCADQRIPFLTFSSDLVFDGTTDAPYLESHIPSPLNVYGRSKAESENQVLSLYSDALVVRTSSFFGPWDHANFATNLLKTLSLNKNFCVCHDIRISPTYIPDLVHTCLELLIDGEHGLLHLTNEGSVSWAEFARTVAQAAAERKISLDPELIVEKSLAELALRAQRPRNSVLKSEKLKIMPTFDDAINRYFKELEIMI
ncbi:MAG: SDR family oxidoreductase [Pseudobdellovibrionaceae bacterium]